MRLPLRWTGAARFNLRSFGCNRCCPADDDRIAEWAESWPRTGDGAAAQHPIRGERPPRIPKLR